MTHLDITRRNFIVSTAAAGGGMMLGFYLPSAAQAANIANNPWERPTAKDGQEINAWLVIDPDGTVTVRVAQSEMGEGIFTSLPMIVAEELQADWKAIKAEYADANRHIKNNNVYQRMSTGGSGAVRLSRVYLQQAGASARERLKEAAAKDWGVTRADVAAKDSVLTSGTKRGTYAEFATKAAQITLDKEPAIKIPDQYTFMGTSVARLDTPLKVNGTATFGIDVRLPGMVYAAVMAHPIPGGDAGTRAQRTLKSFDFNAIKARPGVIGAYELKPQGDTTSGVQPGVAVVADTWYRAKTALGLMPIQWEMGPDVAINSDGLFDRMRKALTEPGAAVSRKDGDAEGAIAKAAKKIEGVYESPYVAHACMEPMNCTVAITNDRVDVYGGFQNPPGALSVVADNLGVQPNNVYTHTTFLGGGFGRRSRNDEVRQAAAVAKLAGKPVKMVWTREEDFRQGTHRPMAVTKFQAGIGADGMPTGLWIRSVQHSITAHSRPEAVVNGLDNGAIEGFRTNVYNIPNQYVDMHIRNSHIPVHFYRSVAVSQNIFQIESFIDEMAQAGGKDPMQYRIDLTKDLPDYQLVLKTLKEKSGWATNLPKGTGMGIGLSVAFGTVVAQVATVSVTRRGALTVEKVVCALDCGHLVNPSIAEAQVQSSIVMGLGDATIHEITVDKGQVVQGNFDTFPIIRMNQMPIIETHFALTGGDKWGGMGEPALPPTAAAVANAIFYATGKRVRSMPFSHTDLSWS